MKIPGYQIQKEIGKGGMATVYLAIQESLGRSVVLKILEQVSNRNTEDMAERFIAEGRIIASLNHPNIITIYDIGISNHLLYISMEYVHGGDLKQRMELPVSEEEALDYLAKVTSALGEAHKHGIVHRDVKPANILFRDPQTPLLTDFGIAKQVNLDTDLTSTGIFLGSPNYVSPEQADGESIDGRADIYSLGCIFYEMLTGNKPYTSSSIIDIVIQHKNSPVPTLPPEYSELQSLLNRMMAKQRGQRVSDAEELIRDINRLQRKYRYHITGNEEDPLPLSPEERAELRNKRSKQILAGLILLALIFFSSLKYVEIRLREDPVSIQQVSTNTVLGEGPIQRPDEVTPQGETAAAGQNGPEPVPPVQAGTDGVMANGGNSPAATAADSSAATAADGRPPEQVLQALEWLGNQSLEEYKLTYPARDNAYYYFTRLLELDPGNQVAIKGILAIADRYAILAEQAMSTNEWEKTAAYADIGLRIDPDNSSLLSLQELVRKQDASILSAIKSLFGSN